MAEKSNNRSSGWTALVINLGATPGLGSYLAGHRWVGALQMVLAIYGFVTLMGWFWELFRGAWESLQAGDSFVWPPARGVILGVALFGAAWLWSLVTSLQIIRAFRKSTPPILSDASDR